MKHPEELLSIFLLSKLLKGLFPIRYQFLHKLNFVSHWHGQLISILQIWRQQQRRFLLFLSICSSWPWHRDTFARVRYNNFEERFPRNGETQQKAVDYVRFLLLIMGQGTWWYDCSHGSWRRGKGNRKLAEFDFKLVRIICSKMDSSACIDVGDVPKEEADATMEQEEVSAWYNEIFSCRLLLLLFLFL